MSEHEEQVALVNWACYNESRYPELALLHANPMGGKRPKRTAIMMKAEGAKAGVPDLFLPVARGGYHGLFIEMKFGKGRLKPEQRWWVDHLQEQGYRVEVCYGMMAAHFVLVDYLEEEHDGQPD